ncbi:MAG: hypothetical protein HY298_25680 [Verrucomicrobia bacterium]|nr:hypothetical protein [Verrucomicrobiota bacterium]
MLAPRRRYAQFFERCDRQPAVPLQFAVQRGNRDVLVAYFGDMTYPGDLSILPTISPFAVMACSSVWRRNIYHILAKIAGWFGLKLVLRTAGAFRID